MVWERVRIVDSNLSHYFLSIIVVPYCSWFCLVLMVPPARVKPFLGSEAAKSLHFCCEPHLLNAGVLRRLCSVA